MLNHYEMDGDFSSRLAMQEELKALPSGAVWDHCFQSNGVLVEISFMDTVKNYEKTELAKRD